MTDDDLHLCPRCERAWIADRLDACTRCTPPLSTWGSPGPTAPVARDDPHGSAGPPPRAQRAVLAVAPHPGHSGFSVVGTGEGCDLVFADAAYGFSGGSA